jgi:hypothetical protein
MKKATVVLLWASALLAPVLGFASLFAAWQLDLLRFGHQTPPAILQELARAGIPPTDPHVPQMVEDFRKGLVMHVDPAELPISLLPALAWGVVYFTDRDALRTLLGRITTWLVFLSLVLMFAASLWLRKTMGAG